MVGNQLLHWGWLGSVVYWGPKYWGLDFLSLHIHHWVITAFVVDCSFEGSKVSVSRHTGGDTPASWTPVEFFWVLVITTSQFDSWLGFSPVDFNGRCRLPNTTWRFKFSMVAKQKVLNYPSSVWVLSLCNSILKMYVTSNPSNFFFFLPFSSLKSLTVRKNKLMEFSFVSTIQCNLYTPCSLKFKVNQRMLLFLALKQKLIIWSTSVKTTGSPVKIFV